MGLPREQIMKRQISPWSPVAPGDIDRTPANQWPLAAIPQQAIEKIFATMQSLYGAKFFEQWRSVSIDSVQRHWGIALGKMTPEQIRRGMTLVETLDLPPTLPQFIKLCKPASDPHAAYFEAIAGIAARERGEAGDWSDAAIYWAAATIGAFDLKTQPYAQISRRWQAALADAQASTRQEPIPAPIAQPLATDEPDFYRNTTTELVAIEKVMKATKSTGSRNDPKRWARRIQERIARGDKTVTKQQARAAKEALDL